MHYSLQVDLQKYISDIFTEVEARNGHENVALVSSLISVSQFGVSKRCLSVALMHASGVDMPLQQASDTISKILSSLSNILSSRWLNGHVVCTWFHKSIEKVAQERYLRDENSVQNFTKMIVDYYQQEPNAFEPVNQVKNRMSLVAESPSAFRKGSSTSNTPKETPLKRQYNSQKLQFFPFYLLQSDKPSELKTLAICNFDFLSEKLRATSVGHILNDFYHALAVDPDHQDLKVMKEFFELAADALTLDPDQFPAQIYSRLHPLRVEQQVNSLEYASTIDKQVLPPPDGKDSSSSESTVEIQTDGTDGNGKSSDIAADIDANERAVGIVKFNETALPSGSNKDIDNTTSVGGTSYKAPQAECKAASHNRMKMIRNSCVLDSLVLTKLVNSAVRAGHLLMPSNPCLIRPPSECGDFSETQLAAFSNQPTDSRILFMGKSPDAFVSWSRTKENIGLYDSNCSCLKLYTCEKLKRVLLTVNESALVEIQDGKIWMFDLMHGSFLYELDSGPRYFAVCDSSHIAAMSDNLSCLSLFNIRSREIVWDFSAPEGRSFHNVLVSKNGAIGACILEANSVGNSRDEPTFGDRDCDVLYSTQDEIVVVNLKSRQQLHSISLRNGQYLHKICSISEDGHYLVHLTEPDHQILVLDLIKGSLVREVEARLHRILKIMVSTQGNCILSASADSVLRVWNLSDGELRYSLSEPIRSIRGGYMDDKHCLGMSEDGSRAVHSVRSQFHCSYVVLWDLVQGKQLATFTTDFYGLTYEISPCGDYIVTSMPSGLVTMGTYKAVELNAESLCSTRVEESD